MKTSHFGLRLKELREERGLSQKQLAERAGLGQRSISNWEQGTREPVWSNVLALAAALGVEVGDFTTPPATVEKPGRGRPPKESTVKTMNTATKRSRTQRNPS